MNQSVDFRMGEFIGKNSLDHQKAIMKLDQNQIRKLRNGGGDNNTEVSSRSSLMFQNQDSFEKKNKRYMQICQSRD